MIKAITACFKIPELRNKILFTLGIVALCRVAAHIPCPGIDPDALERLLEQLEKSSSGDGIVDIANLFSGGALKRFAVAAMGIIPYISAEIIMQLLIPVVPLLKKFKREGKSGCQKITECHLYLTLGICLVQGYLLAKGMENPSGLFGAEMPQVVINPGFNFEIMTVIILTFGTMILVWFVKQITDRGIGSGIALVITIGMLESLPSSLYYMWSFSITHGSDKQAIIRISILVGLFILVTAATIALTVGVRRIPIKYAKAIAGRKGAAGQDSYIPLKVNFAGAEPIIFATAILIFPPLLILWLANHVQWTINLAPIFAYGSIWYLGIYGAIIILFSFFWVANQFNPIQIAEDLKRQAAYIPGIRPGKLTSTFLDMSMVRVTCAGAVFLTVLAVLSIVFSQQLNIPFSIAPIFGGQSLLIIVSTLLGMFREIESYLLKHHYGG